MLNGITEKNYGSVPAEHRVSSLTVNEGSDFLIHTDIHTFLRDNNTENDSSSTLHKSSIRSRASTIIVDVQADMSQIGSATITSEVASISKNLIGAGVLSLSGGISLYSNNPIAIISASVWIILLGGMFAFFCLLIAKVCEKTRSSTYRECWEATMGQGGLAVAIVSTLLPAQGTLSYATVLSYTFQSLLETFHIKVNRVMCLIVLTFFVLLPLCLMKNLDALSGFSALGVTSIGVVMVAMLIRCFDGSYQLGGKFYEEIDAELRPSFGNQMALWSTKVLPFVCMVFQSYVMHYNTARFYMELKEASIPRFARAVGYSFGLSFIMYILIASAGFLTFGGNCSSYILTNYSRSDPLATVGRVGVFFSTLLIYPLAFFGVRDGLLDVFQVPQHMQTAENLNIFTIVVLFILTLGAIAFHDLGLINAVGGGAFATFLCFVFPALMYRNAVVRGAIQNVWESRETWLAFLLMFIGIVLGFAGVYQSIIEATADSPER